MRSTRNPKFTVKEIAMTNEAIATTAETASAAEQSAPVTEKSPAKKGVSQKKAAPKGKKAAEPTTPFDGPEADAKSGKATTKGRVTKKAAKAKKAPKAKSASERTNKKADVIAMMSRAKGATLSEIVESTGWQAHTVRGCVSLLQSRDGIKIESSKNAAGERTYKVAK
jgi:hypothetical protein